MGSGVRTHLLPTVPSPLTPPAKVGAGDLQGGQNEVEGGGSQARGAA